LNIQKNKHKKATLIFAILLMLTIAVPLFALMPNANAHYPAWTYPTYAYITVSPNPIGVSQTATIVFWVDKIPPTAAGTAGDRWFFYLDIKAPDNTTTTQGPFTSDPVGGSYYLFTPDMVGTYTFTSRFGPQVITGSNGTGIYSTNIGINDTYAASTATTTITVQQDAIPAVPNYPLPTEYWTRPIEGQNTQWYTIASNWLASPQIWGKVQLGGSAPNSAHIMWTQPYAFGGVVGGDVSQTGIQDVTYYDGTAYEGVFGAPLIMQGKLYYPLTLSDAAKGSGYVCVDLMTGKQVWWQNWTSVTPTFGQIYDYESINQHGVIRNGYLWASQGTTLIAYDPLTGNWLFNETNVPTGTAAYGPNGEILRYVLGSNGKWLALWNNTAAHGLTASTDPTDYTTTNYNQWRPVGKSVDASAAYSWNVSVPLMTGGTIQGVIYNDVLIGSNGTLPTPGSSWSPYTVWAISLKPETRGNLLWMKNYDAPTGNITLSFAPVFMSLYIDPTTRVFTMYDKEQIQWAGFSVDNGTKLWQTPSEVDFNYYADVGLTRYAVTDGKLFSSGYGGVLYCYDLNTGQQHWNYTAPAGLDAGYPGFPLGIGAISDGKVYLYTTEHSANSPHLKGVQFRCVNETTGAEIWTTDGYGTSGGMAIADGYLVYLNLYDMQIYTVGKGPSQTTVTASPKVSTQGSSVIIEGTVTDIATGTQQTEQAGRFPNGVPAVSDASMSDWMGYVYMQKPRPTNTIGVPVTLYAIDTNNNYRKIGNTTSDENGCFSYSWTPNIAGKYTVIANFDGSESYWPSHAETAFNVDNAPAATQAPTPVPISVADNYFIPAIAGLFVLVIAGFIVLALLMIRKRA
jgi:outer membrane protein assembly factor BamB